MTSMQRGALPDSVHTNGATPNPWWANAVAYQIYPRSFQDTNGDGYGDLNGITSRLEYLADLGIDVVWLSPVYKSPQDDNGYDIADYQAIDPMFGTLDDMDRLLAKAHQLGLKVIMDLVVNHTSDEHAWFQASRDKSDPHADWYWWRPAKPGYEPGTPGAEPNSWGGNFGGSAWQYDPKRGEYYLHLFSPKQPDLNWENPQMRHAVYDMMNWWMDRGVDGFHMDVITLISKMLNPDGSFPEGKLGEEGYSSFRPFCQDGPRQDEFLAEMRREVFEGRDGTLTVGEAPGITSKRNGFITDPANKELDMLFLFNHVRCDFKGKKWNTIPFEVKNLRHELDEQQRAVSESGWASLYFENHDQPRAVSRWGDDSTEALRSLIGALFISKLNSAFGYSALAFGFMGVIVVSVWPREHSNKDVPREPVSLRMMLASFRPPIGRNARNFWYALSGRLLLVSGYTMISTYQLYIVKYHIYKGSKVSATQLSTMAAGLIAKMAVVTLIASLASALLAGPITDFIKMRKLPVALAGVRIAVGVAMPWIFPSEMGMYLFALIAGLGYGVYNAIDQALNVQVLPNPEEAGKDLGILNISNTLSHVIGVALTSWVVVAAHGNYTMIFPVSIAIVLVASFLIMRIKGVR
ncbi:MAG: alpha-amylase family glycosyl hydrolase [Bifidobacterium subtile]|nr:alpha-amylase family glycosyl hydrolase [Bifidobacterium subtile]MCI1257624.1 alpha-amylase family glycosyl hydrolase [Bifidobacterium subtile]